MIYFDNSATTLQKPPAVAQAVFETLSSQQFGNPGRAAHTTAHNALSELFKTRLAVARVFNSANPLDIALCQNATAALNLVLKSLFGPGDHLISTTLEHNSVLRPLYQLEQQGAEVSFIGFNEQNGELDYAEMENGIRSNSRAVIVTACSNVIGAIPDLERIYALCRTHGLILIIDDSQGAGIIPLDLSQYENTIVCFTGHKGLYGPQGTGGIAVHGSFQFKPVFSGGSGIHSFDHAHPSAMPDVFESGTMNVPSFAGLKAGCSYVCEHGIQAIRDYLLDLRSYFLEKAGTVPQVKIYAPDVKNGGPVVGLNIGQLPSSLVSQQLDEQYGIATRPGAHCAPLVHKTFKTEEQGIVRFSFSSFNTKAEIDTAVEALKILSAQAETGR